MHGLHRDSSPVNRRVRNDKTHRCFFSVIPCLRGEKRSMYIELHSRSAFSFLEGASLPEALIAVCADYGMPAMALLDRNGVYGAPRFHIAANKCKVRAHIGAEVTVDDG